LKWIANVALGVIMPEITVKRRGELIKKVIEILKQHPEGLPAKEVLTQLEGSLSLTDFEQSTYPNNPSVRRFEKIVRFSTISPVKAGWIVKSKGRWAVTEEGLKAFHDFKDPEKGKRKGVGSLFLTVKRVY